MTRSLEDSEAATGEVCQFCKRGMIVENTVSGCKFCNNCKHVFKQGAIGILMEANGLQDDTPYCCGVRMNRSGAGWECCECGNVQSNAADFQ